MFDQFPDLLTVTELQAALQVGRNTAYRLVKSGDIPYLKIGKTIRIPKSCVVDYVRRTWYDEGAVDGCSDLVEVTL